MTTLNDYLIASGLLFAIGLAGVVLRRNIIVIFMCLEMMLSAAGYTSIEAEPEELSAKLVNAYLRVKEFNLI